MTQLVDKSSILSVFDSNQESWIGLRGQIIDVARILKMYQVIAREKESYGELMHENFWGWLQTRVICHEAIMSCYKIAKELGRNVVNILKERLSEEQKKVLLKNSELQKNLSALRSITKKYKPYRNKRGSHLDYSSKVGEVSIDILSLYDLLIKIDMSINYINHFLINPHLIIEGKWDAYNLRGKRDVNDLDNLDDFFQDDYVTKDCRDILEKLNNLQM